jgi:hypothetical protein
MVGSVSQILVFHIDPRQVFVPQIQARYLIWIVVQLESQPFRRLMSINRWVAKEGLQETTPMGLLYPNPHSHSTANFRPTRLTALANQMITPPLPRHADSAESGIL